jgi:hypothetical protein
MIHSLSSLLIHKFNTDLKYILSIKEYDDVTQSKILDYHKFFQELPVNPKNQQFLNQLHQEIQFRLNTYDNFKNLISSKWTTIKDSSPQSHAFSIMKKITEKINFKKFKFIFIILDILRLNPSGIINLVYTNSQYSFYISIKKYNPNTSHLFISWDDDDDIHLSSSSIQSDLLSLYTIQFFINDSLDDESNLITFFSKNLIDFYNTHLNGFHNLSLSFIISIIYLIINYSIPHFIFFQNCSLDRSQNLYPFKEEFLFNELCYLIDRNELERFLTFKSTISIDKSIIQNEMYQFIIQMISKLR